MYLTSDLATAVKRRAAIPISQVTFQNVDLYQLADEEVRSKLIPLITKNIEEFYITYQDLPIVANQAAYTIPTRAVATGLRNVQVVDSANKESRVELERLDPTDLYTNTSVHFQMKVQKTGFYLQGNQVILYPAPTAAINTLRLSYVCRPNSLVDVTACARVQSINTSLNQITVASLPSTFTTSTPLDFVQALPAFDWTAQDQTPTVINGLTLTFGSTLPAALAVGDYLCLSGQTCVMQVPVELQPLLYQYVTVRVLSAQGDAQALQAAVAELSKLEENAELLIAPRVKGKSKRVVNSRPISRWL